MAHAKAVVGQGVVQALHAARYHHTQGALDEARKLYRQVLKIVPNQPDAVQLLGLVEFQQGNLLEAERLLTRAIKLRPDDASAHVNLGALLKRLNRLPQAVRAYREAIRLKPDLAVAHYNLGGTHYDQREYALAIDAYKEAVKFDPRNVEALVNLGNSYKCSARSGTAEWTRALECYEQALAVDANASEAYSNAGSVFRDREWHNASLLMYDKAIALAPDHLQHRMKRAMVSFPAGRLEMAWNDYEFRFYADGEEFPKRSGPPYWEGEDLSDKKIFVWPEQGLGEQIFFGSLLPDLMARGAAVVFESKPRLAKVFARSFPKAQVISRRVDSAKVDPGDADLQIALASLGRFFRRDIASFPRHEGYLRADAQKVAAIHERYRKLAGGRRVIGLSWRSKNERFGVLKSTKLTDWAAILRVPGVFFVNLQYGDCRADLADVRRELGIEVYQDPEIDPMGDLDDFFAQVAALDLVISTSNTTVHVSGSLNIPTWLILSPSVGVLWYWYMGRENNAWYPSIRIFRNRTEKSEGRWRPVLAEVERALEQWVAQ